MRALGLILKSLLVIAGIVVGGIAVTLIVFGWSSSNTKTAHGECEMLTIEKKIEPLARANDYRQACMAAKGYGMSPQCFVLNNTAASCFIPTWIFWVNKF